MRRAQIILDRDFVIGDVDPRLFGSFIEHLGRAVYSGIYEPGHPRADADGFRTDVSELVRELGMTIVRYPGGNFVSGYNWEDGIGPREKRPRRLDLAWKSLETNQVGTDDFVLWCRKTGVEPMIAVNLGSRGPADAARLVEYCNVPAGTALSDLRRANGFAEPHRIRVWCLGNEMDGPWQIGHKNAAEYGRVAREAAKMMKWVDPDIQLVACGSSGRGMSTFGAWELAVLEETYDHVDYLSLHTYLGNWDKDSASFFARPEEMNDFISETVALCDAAAAKRKSRKRMMLSFDEWNVWYHQGFDSNKARGWPEAPPLLEDIYTVEDALAVGGMIITLLNHADRVRIACLAQLVNVIAPIMTEKGGRCWRQTIFHPFAQTAALARGGIVLRPVVKCPVYDSRAREGTPVLAAACVLDPAGGSLAIFAVNRCIGRDGAIELSVDLRAFPQMKAAQWTVLTHRNLKAVNSASRPEAVRPRPVAGASLAGGRLSAILPPASWNTIVLRSRK